MSKKITKKHISSALPIYGAAGIFFVASLILPIYKLWAIIGAAALAAGGYFGLTKVYPGRDEITEEEVLTGNKELDERIMRARSILERFSYAADRADDDAVRNNIARIIKSADGIVDEVIADAADRGDAYTFFEYYLPTLDQLLGYYTGFALSDKGENAVRSRERIESCLAMVADAFEKFLDKLYHNEAVSIKASVDVMKTMLRADGLAGREAAPASPKAYDPVVGIENINARLREEAKREQGITLTSN